MTERPRPLREVRDTVPPHVAMAVQSALEKLPADRPAGAAMFARMLADESVRTVTLPTMVAATPRRRLAWRFGGAGGRSDGGGVGMRGLASRGSRRARFHVKARAPLAYARWHRKSWSPPSDRAHPGWGGCRLRDREPSGRQFPLTAAARRSPAGDDRGNREFDGSAFFAGRTVADGVGITHRSVRITRARIPDSGRGRDTGSASCGHRSAVWCVDHRRRLLEQRLQRGADSAAYPRRARHSCLPGAHHWLAAAAGARAGTSRARDSGTARERVGNIMVLELESGEQTTVLDAAAVEARYTAGFLVYTQSDGILMAAPFDPVARRTTGTPVQIATGISLTGERSGTILGGAQRHGRLRPRGPSLTCSWRPIGGLPPRDSGRAQLSRARVFPGREALSVDFTGNDGRDVWILSLAQGTLSRATFDRDGHDGTWSPDGQYLTYTTIKTGTFGLFRVRVGSAGPAESLLVSSSLGYTGSGCAMEAILLHRSDLKPGTGTDIVLIRNGGHGPVEPVIVNQFQTDYPMPSPDGKWFAYVSNQSGEQEVFVRSLDPGGEEVQVSQEGATSRSGRLMARTLLSGHVERRIKLMAAAIRTSRSWRSFHGHRSSRSTILLGRRPMPITRLAGWQDVRDGTPSAGESASSCCRTYQNSCDGFGKLRGKKRSDLLHDDSPCHLRRMNRAVVLVRARNIEFDRIGLAGTRQDVAVREGRQPCERTP